MDGFHLAQAVLERTGRADRKGVPDTFDAAGYVALLRRLREPRQGPAVYAPVFDRSLEEPIAGSIPVPPPLVITEGNYLLHDAGEWALVRPLLDEVWYLDPEHEHRLQRLIDRHIKHGKDPVATRAWVTRLTRPRPASSRGAAIAPTASSRPAEATGAGDGASRPRPTGGARFRVWRSQRVRAPAG